MSDNPKKYIAVKRKMPEEPGTMEKNLSEKEGESVLKKVKGRKKGRIYREKKKMRYRSLRKSYFEWCLFQGYLNNLKW